MDNKPYDSAFKDLADADVEALLRLIGALPPGADVRPLRPEISAPALATDQPYEVITATDHYIAHLEAQTRWKANVPDRVVRYEAIFWINKQLPVHTYVLVFISDGMPDNPPNRCLVKAGDLTLISEFTIVRFWELSAADALAQNNENLLPFIPLMRGGGEQIEQCAQALGQIENETRQRALSIHFVSMGSLRYNRENLIQLLGRTTMIPERILRETPYIQSIMAEGREEGREEGQHQAVVELLLVAIGKRFPGLDFKADVERVPDTEVLKQLFVELDQIPDVNALRQRLAALTPIRQP